MRSAGLGETCGFLRRCGRRTDLACYRAVSRLRRPILRSRFFFVTTNLRKGLRPFNETEFRLLAESLIRVREIVPVAICAYCFMPDHTHSILFPQEGTTISDVMMRFKVVASRRIRPIRGRAFWQARFYDRALRNRGEYDEAFDYIHMNPVRRGLVEEPLQWRWSSARWFAEQEKTAGLFEPCATLCPTRATKL